MSTNKNHMEAVYQLLRDDTAIQALVGSRIFPTQRPQESGFPAIVYSQLSEDRIETKDISIPNGHRFTLELYADQDDPTGGYPKVQSIAKACKNLLEWYDGTVDSQKYRIRFRDQNDAPFEEAPEAFKIIQDYSLRVI